MAEMEEAEKRQAIKNAQLQKAQGEMQKVQEVQATKIDELVKKFELIMTEIMGLRAEIVFLREKLNLNPASTSDPKVLPEKDITET